MAAQHDHGHTPAAWTGVIVAFVGFLVSGVFTVAAQPVGFWVGIAIIVLGAVVGGVMHLLGMGKKPEPLVRTSDLAEKDEARVHAGA
jgi:hypothetical protein